MTSNSPEYMRRWRAANADRIRQYKLANADQIRENDRRNYHANRASHLAGMKRWRAANLERAREGSRRYYAANAEQLREYARQQRRDGRKTPRQRQAAEIVAKFLQEQDGRCYLCETALTLDKAVLEHDHRCCPKMNTWCVYCVRGAACGPCNRAIGLLLDDPGLIERVARNLRVKMAEIDQRMVTKPVQDMLPLP